MPILIIIRLQPDNPVPERNSEIYLDGAPSLHMTTRAPIRKPIRLLRCQTAKLRPRPSRTFSLTQYLQKKGLGTALSDECM